MRWEGIREKLKAAEYEMGRADGELNCLRETHEGFERSFMDFVQKRIRMVMEDVKGVVKMVDTKG